MAKRLAADSSSIATGAHSSFFHLHLTPGASSRTITAVNPLRKALIVIAIHSPIFAFFTVKAINRFFPLSCSCLVSLVESVYFFIVLFLTVISGN